MSAINHIERGVRERTGRFSFWTSTPFEAICGFSVMLPMLFVAQLGAAGVALALLFMLLYAWFRRHEAAMILVWRWPLLLVAAFALASAIWSDYPALTLKHALELTGTIAAGILMSASRRPTSLLTGFWAAFGLYVLVSFLMGHSAAVGSAGETAFTGLNGGKNYFAMISALGALMSVFMLLHSGRKGRLIGAAAAAALFGLEVYLVDLALSAGATLALVLALAAMLAAASLGALRPGARQAVGVFLTPVMIAAGMIGYTFANSVTTIGLHLFHKDPTLTGRSYLWYRATDFIAERPLLGHGFEAFWVQGNIDAEGLWQFARLTNRGGFNFHNTLIESLIDFGWIGTGLIILVFVWALIRLPYRVAREPTLAGALYIGLVVFHLVRMPFESLIPGSVDFATFLLIVALGYGFEPYSPEARRTPAATAQLSVQLHPADHKAPGRLARLAHPRPLPPRRHPDNLV